jgi:hypothetical protein
MADVEHWGLGNSLVSHFSKPCLEIPALKAMGVTERYLRQNNQGDLTVLRDHGGVIHEKLINALASVEWIQAEQRRFLLDPANDIRPVRSIQSGITSFILNMKDIFDAIPPILDAHMSFKRGQLSGVGTPSMSGLLKNLRKNGRSAKLLPFDVQRALHGLESIFGAVRAARNDLVHYGGKVEVVFRAGEVLFLVSKFRQSKGSGMFFDCIAQRQMANPFEYHYDFNSFVVAALSRWLDFWLPLEPYAEAKRSVLAGSPHYLDAPFGLASDYIATLHMLFSKFGIEDRYRFIWPCSPECKGSLGGCPNPPGGPEDWRLSDQ